MTWRFQSDLKFTGDGECICLAVISETEVWAGWSSGKITWHTHVQDPDYQSDNFFIGIPDLPLPSGEVELSTLIDSWIGPMIQTFIGPPISMTKCLNRVYVATIDSLYQFDCATRKLVAIAPLSINDAPGSNLCSAGGRVWFAGTKWYGPEQQILYYITATPMGSYVWNTLESVFIPGRHQILPRTIIDGLAGNLLITNMNNHGIISVPINNPSGAVSYTINRHPYSLSVNQNKKVYVMSDKQPYYTKGMISEFDQSTGVSTPLCSGGDATAVLDDLRTGYLWIVGGDTGMAMRINPIDQIALVAATEPPADPPEDPPADPLPPALDVLKGKLAVLTSTVTIDYYNKSTGATYPATIRSYMYLASGSNLVAYRLTDLVRVNSCEVRGTAMISTGDQDYFGDEV